MDIGEFLISGRVRAAQNLIELGDVTSDGAHLLCGDHRVDCGSEELAARLAQVVADLTAAVAVMDAVDDPTWDPPVLDTVRGLLRDVADEGVSGPLTDRISDLLGEPVTERLPFDQR